MSRSDVPGASFAKALDTTGLGIVQLHGRARIVAAIGRKESTIRSNGNHMFAKYGLSRQADLVRLVLSLAGAAQSRR